MPLLGRKTPEERAAHAAEKARKRFFNTPAGRARLAYEASDHVFQYEYDVMSQKAIVVMRKNQAVQRTSDPSEILNSVCLEGWELVTGSFVFVQTGEVSRNRAVKSGQQIGIHGKVIGCYLFKRCEENRSDLPKPWETQAGLEDAMSDDEEE